MSNKKALLGGLLGIVIGLAIPGGGFVFAMRGFAIGFSIGQLLFPPEIEDDGKKEEFNVTGPTPTAPIPVIWGFRHTSGSIIYFGFNNWEKKKYSDDRYYWAPMQIAICMSPFARVKIRAGDFAKWMVRTYFEVKPHEIMSYTPTDKSDMSGQTIIDSGGDSDDVIQKHSKPFLSQGNDPIDTQQAYKVDGLGGGYYARQYELGGSSEEVFIEAKTFSFWPTKDKLPPLRNVVTLSHPRWYMGEGTTAPNMKFETYCEIDLSASTWAWAVTYPELGQNQAFTTHLGLSPAQAYWDVFTNPLSFMGFPESILDEASFLYAEALFEAEGYRVNALINAIGSAHSLLEMLNFHVNSILRSNAAGKLELLPLRRLDDVTNPQIDFDTETFEAAVPGKPTVYTVRDNDIKDIDVSTDTWDAVANEFQGRFPNKAKNFDDDGHTRKNEAGKAMTGRWIRRSYNFPMFTRRPLVNRRLLELMRFGSRPKSIATITLDHRYNSIRKQDGLLVFSDEFDFNGLYFRVSDVEYGDLGDSRITVRCVLDTEALSVGQDDVTDDDDEEGPVETALSAQDVGGHVEYWPSNVAFEDKISGAALPERSPATAIFGIQLYVARKSSFPTDSCVQTALGILTATANDGTDDALLLPETSPCTQPMANWAYRFTLVMDVYRDDHRYANSVANGGTPIRVRLSSFEDHDLDLESDLDDKIDNADWESNSWVAIVTGTPVDKMTDPSLNTPSIVEVWRFRKLVKIETGSDEEGTLYELQDVLRSSNKEHPQGWRSGQELWIVEIFREGNLPTVPDGVEGSIGGATDNFAFVKSEYDTWISLYNDPTDLRNGHGGAGDNTAITGATGLASSGHIVNAGGPDFIEGTDYEVDDETGLFYIYESGSIAVGNLTITLILNLSTRWAHRHISSPAGQITNVLGTKRVRMYTQGRRIENNIIVDAEGPLEGIRRDFQRSDSNFFGGIDRRRAAISPFTGAVAFKGDQQSRYSLHDKGYNADRCCIITDVRHNLGFGAIDYPASFKSTVGEDWRVVGASLPGFSIGFSGEFDQIGRVFSMDTLQSGTEATDKGWFVRIEDHPYPAGNKIVPVFRYHSSAGTQILRPVGDDGNNPDGSILGFNIQTPNIVITVKRTGSIVTCNFYIAGAWIGDASGPSGEVVTSTGGRMSIAEATGHVAATGHYWDMWLCNHVLEKDTDQIALDDYEAPPGCLFFLPMRQPTAVGLTTFSDLSGLKNDFVKTVGAISADVLDTGNADFDPKSYYIQFPPHSDDGGFGDAWLNAGTLPANWKQLENSAGIDGTDEGNSHFYADESKYPEHQTTWYRLDVYVRWTGLETHPDPDLQGEAFLLRSGQRVGLKDPNLYDSMLEVEISTPRHIEDSEAWPTLVYTASMLDFDKARYEALTTAGGADWREADLIFVMYKCKGEVAPKIGGTKVLKPWNVPTVVPIFGRGQLNYYGAEFQLVNSSQVND